MDYTVPKWIRCSPCRSELEIIELGIGDIDSRLSLMFDTKSVLCGNMYIINS
jgi:hypothetical protein